MQVMMNEERLMNLLQYMPPMHQEEEPLARDSLLYPLLQIVVICGGFNNSLNVEDNVIGNLHMHGRGTISMSQYAVLSRLG